MILLVDGCPPSRLLTHPLKPVMAGGSLLGGLKTAGA
jgi:hypothetical protein